MAHLIIVDVVPPTLSFEDQSEVLSANGTHTHSGLSFGQASPSRAIIAIFTGTSGSHGSITSVTIGGVSAALVIKQNDVPGDNAAYIYIAAVPNGTSGNVVLAGVPSGTNWSSSCAVYAATNLISLSATDSSGHAVNSGGTVSTSVTVQPLGVVVSNAYCTVECTGCSMSGVTRDFFDVIGSSPNQAQGGGSFIASASQTLSTSVTFTGGSGFFNPIIASASFR